MNPSQKLARIALINGTNETIKQDIVINEIDLSVEDIKDGIIIPEVPIKKKAGRPKTKKS